MKHSPVRRTLLKRFAAGAGVTVLSGAGVRGLGIGNARAAGSLSGYKALVCLYMAGGNDGFNWVVPTSASAYSAYASARSDLALPSAGLLPLSGTASDGYAYGLHPSCPELQALYNAGHAAVVCNVGTLLQPTTAAQAIAGTASLPPQLFSHVDQTTEWMTAIPQSVNRYGWAGRVADLLAAQGNTTRLAFNINVGGTNYWQEGATTIPYVLGSSGAPTLQIEGNAQYRDGARAQATAALLAQASSDTNLMTSEFASVWKNADAKVTLVNGVLSAAGDLATVFPAAVPGDFELGLQLHEVARVIKAQPQLGDARQMFFVQIGNFDTHSGQLATQAQQLGFVSRQVNAFYNAMVEIGQQNNVTLFTMSDFGRTLTSNNGGADHGWGSHALVVGGAVKGAAYYGRMPTLALGGPDDVGLGRIVPSTSSDQYAATLASWFGVAASDLPGLFPNLSNFSSPTLGFV